MAGPEHPETLSSRNNLATARRGAGRTDEAITLFEQTLADRERLLGSDHPRSRGHVGLSVTGRQLPSLADRSGR